jgi:hypothetical protein
MFKKSEVWKGNEETGINLGKIIEMKPNNTRELI